jgi:hypothetical protein
MISRVVKLNSRLQWSNSLLELELNLNPLFPIIIWVTMMERIYLPMLNSKVKRLLREVALMI